MHAHKLLTRADLLARRSDWRTQGRRLVLTNGCFDVLHRGHVEYLQEARGLGEVLVVALNSDCSVRALKGPDRPIIPSEDRAAILCALGDVDFVTIFPEPSVEALVTEVLPDVLVKGGDYRLDQIVGREVVEASGGRVIALSHTPDRSSSDLQHLIKGD